MTMWFGPTPYMVCLMKEIITALVKAGGLDGTYFLRGLGIDEIGELSEMDNMSGNAVADFFEAAMLSVPRDILVQLGLVEAA